MEMIIIASAIFGLIIGSFLNVCIYRIPANKSIIKPGSHCGKCGKPIKFYDNIPIVSYILLRGKCRNCGDKFSARYMIVESLTAVLTILLTVKHIQNPFWLAIVLTAMYMLITLSFIDLDRLIIPDRFSLGLVVLGIASAGINPAFGGLSYASFLKSALGALIGFSLMYLIAVLGEKIFKKEAMGGGDLKLMAGAGALFGAQGVFSVLFIASFFGAVYGVFLLISGKAKRGDAIPFGPFISMGMSVNLYNLILFSDFLRL